MGWCDSSTINWEAWGAAGTWVVGAAALVVARQANRVAKATRDAEELRQRRAEAAQQAKDDALAAERAAATAASALALRAELMRHMSRMADVEATLRMYVQTTNPAWMDLLVKTAARLPVEPFPVATRERLNLQRLPAGPLSTWSMVQADVYSVTEQVLGTSLLYERIRPVPTQHQQSFTASVTSVADAVRAHADLSMNTVSWIMDIYQIPNKQNYPAVYLAQFLSNYKTV